MGTRAASRSPWSLCARTVVLLAPVVAFAVFTRDDRLEGPVCLRPDRTWPRAARPRHLARAAQNPSRPASRLVHLRPSGALPAARRGAVAPDREPARDR